MKPIKDKNSKNKNDIDNSINYTIIEKISVTKNDSKPIQFFNDYFTKDIRQLIHDNLEDTGDGQIYLKE